MKNGNNSELGHIAFSLKLEALIDLKYLIKNMKTTDENGSLGHIAYF